MERVARLILLIGLIFSGFVALIFSVRILLGQILGVSWFWGGAIGAYFGPLAFAAALFVYDKAGKRSDA